MRLDAILGNDDEEREAAIAACVNAPEHERSAFASKLAPIARETAAALAADEEAGRTASPHAAALGRACLALSILRVEAAKSCLLRIADEGSPGAKGELARALRGTTTAEGRAVLVYLLSDDEARPDAIRAIDAAPWPEVLPLLVEISEADDQSARIAARAIARCGATAGPNERYAAADFLLEQLGDDAVLMATFDALLRFGATFPGLVDRAKRLAKDADQRKVAGLCLVAAFGDDGNASLLELALSGSKADPDGARALLAPLRDDPDERIRQAAERTWRALDLR
jgi:hypothetical protein